MVTEVYQGGDRDGATPPSVRAGFIPAPWGAKNPARTLYWLTVEYIYGNHVACSKGGPMADENEPGTDLPEAVPQEEVGGGLAALSRRSQEKPESLRRAETEQAEQRKSGQTPSSADLPTLDLPDQLGGLEQPDNYPTRDQPTQLAGRDNKPSREGSDFDDKKISDDKPKHADATEEVVFSKSTDFPSPERDKLQQLAEAHIK